MTSHLPKLRYLDDKGINQDERESAHRIYGRRRVGGTTGGRRDIPANVRRVCEYEDVGVCGEEGRVWGEGEGVGRRGGKGLFC